MTEQLKPEILNQETRRVTLDKTRHFTREGFDGFDYGDETMLIEVHGEHPLKRIDTGKRSYIIAHTEGEAEFTLNGETYPINKGDKFIIGVGSEYKYKGENMTLIEQNDPGTKDTKLENK
jgi:mannose-6-phosphate isomerase class I